MSVIDSISRTLLIRPHERRQAGYFLLLFFIIGCGMAIGRASAEALFFKRYGIEHLPLMFMIQGGMLFFATTAYASFADRLAPERLLKPLLLILGVMVVCFWGFMAIMPWGVVYPLYYLVYEMASEIIIVHCMLYLARNFDVMQAKRLTPLILGGWQVGAVAGGITLASTVQEIGVQKMLLFWVGLLLVAVVLVTVHHRKQGVSAYHRAGRKGGHPVKHAVDQLQQGVSFARKSSLLKVMSLALFFMVITFYVLCYSVNRVYTKTFTSEVELTMFFGLLGAGTGIVALLIQIFFTNRLIRRFGVRKMNLFFPSMTLVGFAALVVNFSLPAAVLGSLIKDALMPAIRNPVRALFFNALPSFIQGRSHAVSVGIVLPVALASAGMALMLAQHIANVLYFLTIGMITATAYLFFSYRMNKAYVTSIINSLREKLFVPNHNMMESIKEDEQNAIQVLLQASQAEEAEVRFTAAKTMLDLFPDKAAPIVLNVAAGLNAVLKDQLLHRLAPLEPPQLREHLWQVLQQSDDHLRATALYLLFKVRDHEARSIIADVLNDDNPRIRAVAIYGVLHYPVEHLREEAMSHWRQMFNSEHTPWRIAALDLLVKWPNTSFTEHLLHALQSDDVRIQSTALQALAAWPKEPIAELPSILQNGLHHDNHEIRLAAVRLANRLGASDRRNLAMQAIEDAHPDVRLAAAAVLFPTDTDDNAILQWLLHEQGSARAQAAVLQLFVSRNPTRDGLQQIAHHRANEAFSLLEAQRMLKTAVVNENDNANAAGELLHIVLMERCQQTLDQALVAAERYEDATTIGVIRAGIKSGDQRHMASAAEAVRYLDDAILGQYIAALLERFTGESRKPAKLRAGFHDLDTLWQWLEEKQDPWLLTCVKNAKAVVA